MLFKTVVIQVYAKLMSLGPVWSQGEIHTVFLEIHQTMPSDKYLSCVSCEFGKYFCFCFSHVNLYKTQDPSSGVPSGPKRMF